MSWRPSSKIFVGRRKVTAARLVFRNLNGGEHGAFHALERNQVATGIGNGYVHLSLPFPGLCRSGLNSRLGLR
jgi:hypothetical protein